MVISSHLPGFGRKTGVEIEGFLFKYKRCRVRETAWDRSLTSYLLNSGSHATTYWEM